MGGGGVPPPLNILLKLTKLLKKSGKEFAYIGIFLSRYKSDLIKLLITSKNGSMSSL